MIKNTLKESHNADYVRPCATILRLEIEANLISR